MRVLFRILTEISQSCATGTTAEGKTPKHLVEEMVPLLDSHEIRQVQSCIRIACPRAYSYPVTRRKCA